MKISVAMASFNGEQFIHAQLESLSSQTVLPDELVVTDDGSTDRTVEIVEAFRANAPFQVTLIRNVSRLGPGHNFASAMTRSTGDIVFLCDQDDVWDKDKIERMARKLPVSPGILCLLCDARFTDSELNTTGLTKLGAIRSARLPDEVFVQGCCAAIRRELLELALPMPPEEHAHDNWVVGLSDALGATYRLSESLQYYRIHGRNTSDFFVNRTDRETFFQKLSRKTNDILRKFGGGGGIAAEHARLSRIYQRIFSQPCQLSASVGAERASSVTSTLKHRTETLETPLLVRSVRRCKRPTLIRTAIRNKRYPIKASIIMKDLLVSRNSDTPIGT